MPILDFEFKNNSANVIPLPGFRDGTGERSWTSYPEKVAYGFTVLYMALNALGLSADLMGMECPMCQGDLWINTNRVEGYTNAGAFLGPAESTLCPLVWVTPLWHMGNPA